jgi:hypothetical protein
MVMITCRAQRSANRQTFLKKSADHINSDKIKLYTKFIYRLKFVVIMIDTQQQYIKLNIRGEISIIVVQAHSGRKRDICT